MRALSNGDIVSELANFCSQAMLTVGVLGCMWLTSCPRGNIDILKQYGLMLRQRVALTTGTARPYC